MRIIRRTYQWALHISLFCIDSSNALECYTSEHPALRWQGQSTGLYISHSVNHLMKRGSACEGCVLVGVGRGLLQLRQLLTLMTGRHQSPTVLFAIKQRMLPWVGIEAMDLYFSHITLSVGSGQILNYFEGRAERIPW